jgi:hypothetical protein
MTDGVGEGDVAPARSLGGTAQLYASVTLARISAENPFAGHRSENNDKYQCGKRWHGA